MEALAKPDTGPHGHVDFKLLKPLPVNMHSEAVVCTDGAETTQESMIILLQFLQLIFARPHFVPYEITKRSKLADSKLLSEELSLKSCPLTIMA